MTKPKHKQKSLRTTEGLRDLLFDEIDALRADNADVAKSVAVANIAKQIINVAKCELEFKRVLMQHEEAGRPMELGDMRLGAD